MTSNRFRIAAAALLGGALALSLVSPASAFVRITRQGPNGIVQNHWNVADLPVQFVINPTNSDKSDAIAEATIETAALHWQDIPTSYFTVNPHQYTGSAPEVPPALAFDGQNSAIFDATGANFPTAGVIAFTRSITDGTDGHMLDADLVFNDRDFWWSTSASLEPAPAGQSSVDLEAVATHEFGHAWGLDHTSVLGATMIPFIQNDTSQRTLELDDTAGNSTIYPEPDFATTTGTISGTVENGFNGSAIFGAHVEAYLLSDPTPAHEISAISGELTIRNGHGEYTIHGLPPGDYAVAIVPLDGIHTTANDDNFGGVFNGLDIGFEPEFWNGANESANGFTDHPNDFSPVTVAAGGAVTGIDFQTNTYAGRVTIAQYGAFENIVTFRNTGYLAVRFDPPFDVPYNINQVDFPSFTFNGVPAPFLSAKLCPMNANGLPDIANPIFSQTPFPGNPNGDNLVPLNVPGTIGGTYFWVMQFPSQAVPGFPNNFPFMRMDFVQLERGLFANSYTVPLSGPGAGVLIDRNLTVSMQCQLSDANATPISASASLGANRRATQTEFRYLRPTDVRADGFPMGSNSLDHVDLIERTAVSGPGTYSTIASGGAGASSIKVSPSPANTPPTIWSTQAVDKNGHKSVQSSVTILGNGEDADEPNGQAHEATVLTPPVVNRLESYSPAGDQDYYSVSAKVGDVITASATHVGTLDGRNDPDYVMFLLDNSGDVVAFNDDFTGLDPKVVFTVPPPSGNSNSKAARNFTILVTDFYGSALNPAGAPRNPSPQNYRLDVSVTTPVSASAALLASRGLNPDDYVFVNSGPNPANPISKLLYVIPRSAGAQNVTLRIYDVNGRLVKGLVSGMKDPGPYTAIWDGHDDAGNHVASGNYFARLEVGHSFARNTTITILK